MIPVWSPQFTSLEKKFLVDCIDTGWVSSSGPYVSKFEKKVSEFVGVTGGVATSSGTAALETAMHVAGLKPGDEIIMPNFTIISNAVAALRVGATPVFVDADLRTWNMDLRHTEALITPQTKAIMVVHIFGLPVDMAEIGRIARKYKLIVIEDCAESMGGEFDGRQTGSFGDLSVFSFFANKSITSGEGGMVLGNNPELLSRARKYRNLYFGEGPDKFIHEELGFNYRLSNLQAAVGYGQMLQVDNVLNRQRAIAGHYTKGFEKIKCLYLPLNTATFHNSYWVYGLLLKDSFGVTAREMISALKEEGVESRAFFTGMHSQPCLKNRMVNFEKEYPVSDYLATYGFYLPSGPGLSIEKQDRVIEAVCACLPSNEILK